MTPEVTQTGLSQREFRTFERGKTHEICALPHAFWDTHWWRCGGVHFVTHSWEICVMKRTSFITRFFYKKVVYKKVVLFWPKPEKKLRKF